MRELIKVYQQNVRCGRHIATTIFLWLFVSILFGCLMAIDNAGSFHVGGGVLYTILMTLITSLIGVPLALGPVDHLCKYWTALQWVRNTQKLADLHLTFEQIESSYNIDPESFKVGYDPLQSSKHFFSRGDMNIAFATEKDALKFFKKRAKEFSRGEDPKNLKQLQKFIDLTNSRIEEDREAQKERYEKYKKTYGIKD